MAYHLLSYEADGCGRAGIKMGDTVWDAAELTGNSRYVSVIDILNDWEAADSRLAAIASAPKAPEGGRPLPSITLLAPVLYPGQVFAAGSNYQDHVKEMDASAFKGQNAKKAGGRPWFFGKTSRSAVVGPGSIQPLPAYSQKVDWEVELAVVIGRTAAKVPVGEALNYVAGYTVANDLSARDFVARGGVEPDSPFRFDWISHKGFDGALPMGPWITPARFIADPQALDLKLWVDGKLLQDSNTRQMIFSIAEQIEELSARVTLHPGDVILTGTPSGVGMSRGVFLQPGQQLRLYIEQVGELQHGFAPQES